MLVWALVWVSMILMMYLSVCLVYLSDPVRNVLCLAVGGRERVPAGGPVPPYALR